MVKTFTAEFIGTMVLVLFGCGAAVLGGIGSIPGAMLGGILLGVIETLVTGYLSSTYRDAIAFVVLVLILLYRPTGLFGAPQTEKV